MRRKLGVAVYWMREVEPESVLERVRIADEVGVDAVWVSEGWGQDAFSSMSQIVERTSRIRVGTSIVNVFSRSPAALAQHFASLDRLSGGRMLIGLGTSGPRVVEHFHGVPFERPLRRLRETVEIIDALLAGEPLHYRGEIFTLDGGFALNLPHPRPHIPILIAALSPKSVAQTAEIADGWLPLWTPVDDLPRLIGGFRDRARAAGRAADELLVRAPGTIVVTQDVQRTRGHVAATLAFYVARMGEFYYGHVARLGYRELADGVREAWRRGGAAAAAAAIPGEFQQAVGLVTDSVAEARERLAREAEAGVDLHCVEVRAESPREMGRTLEALGS